MRIIGVLLVAFSLQAETIVTSVQCSLFGYQTQTSATQCSLPGIPSAGGSRALITVNNIMEGYSGQIAVSAGFYWGPLQTPDGLIGGGSTTVSVQMSGSITTAGQARSGYARLAFTGSCEAGDGVCSGVTNFGEYSGYVYKSPIPGGPCTFANCNALVPMALGVAIPVSLSAFATCGGLFSVCGGGPQSRLTFSFFEADGSTPVAFGETPVTVHNPEPGTLALLLSAGMALIRRKL